MIIRHATPQDAEALGAMHHQSWVQTWQHAVPPEFWNEFTVSSRQQVWRQVLESGAEVWLAELDGAVVGLAGASTHDGGPVPQELHALYLLAEHHGSGTARTLMHAAIGDRPTFCWVADPNPRAQAFYRRNGFRPDGATDRQQLTSQVAFDVVRLVRQ